MRTIQITTTQNVDIEYELAAWSERFVAFLLDIVAILISFFVFIWLLNKIIQDYEMWDGVIVGGIAFFLPLYFPICEQVFHGRSMGKKVVGIRVVKIRGDESTLLDYIIRWAFAMIEIFMCAGILGSIMILTSEKNQRLGDLFADTAVIRDKPKTRISLTDILKIQTRDGYEPVYPQAKSLREADVILIKQTIDRHRRYNKKEYEKVIGELSSKLIEILEIEEKPTDSLEFLRQILKDYIVLTR